MTQIDLKTFSDKHILALEALEAKHNLILSIIGSALNQSEPTLRTWSLGSGTACAVQTPGWPLVLGDLDDSQSHALASDVANLAMPVVLGPDETVSSFLRHLMSVRNDFGSPFEQFIYELDTAPEPVAVSGEAHPVLEKDTELVVEWVTAFHHEADPGLPLPDAETLRANVTDGNTLLWCINGCPVSMAKLSRRTRNTIAIGGVYTPPQHRRQGFAGAVTAAQVYRIIERGKAAILFTIGSDPASNRCYQKIGFRKICRFLKSDCI